MSRAPAIYLCTVRRKAVIVSAVKQQGRHVLHGLHGLYGSTLNFVAGCDVG